jgi:hypothetical protein
LSTHGDVKATHFTFVTIGDLSPRRLGVASYLPTCGGHRQVCTGYDLAPLVERINIVKRESRWKKNQLSGSEVE